MKKGIFWYKSTIPRLISISVPCDTLGTALEPVNYSSKSGDNFNHKAEWEKLGKNITGGMPYNYYPRGRVEIKDNKAIIFLNPDINNEAVLKTVFKDFELDKANELRTITVCSDGSEHYRYLKGEV